MQTLRNILKPVASLRLTVALLAIAMVVIFAGTLAQRDAGIWQVQHQFFHSWFTWIRLKDLIFVQAPDHFGVRRLPTAIPFIGGYTLIGLLLLNLLAAHFTRFKLRWSRSGVILTHLGLIMLLVGEVVTSAAATEGIVQLRAGEAVNYTQDIRASELALTDSSPADHDQVTVIPASALANAAQNLRNPSLPFDVQVESFYPNSMILGPMQPGGEPDPRVNAGSEIGRKIIPLAPFRGAGEDAEKVDMPAAICTFWRDGKNLGTYSLSPWARGPQTVQTPDGKKYQVEMRYKRVYKPYTIEALELKHDLFQNSDIDKNFSSKVRIVDRSHGVDREAVIWMNHPLRYAGETFYQQGYRNDPGGRDLTTLQVVHNPAAIVPYLALGVAIVGLIIQFGGTLLKFLHKRRLMAARPALELPAEPRSKDPRQPKGSRREPALPAKPAFGWIDLGLPALVTFLGVCTLIVAAFPSPIRGNEKYDLQAFGALPVYYGGSSQTGGASGRTMPLDTLARITLKIIHGSESVTRAEDDRIAPTQWLLDVMAKHETADRYPSFRIDNPEVLGALGLDSSRKYFSFEELINQRQLEPQFKAIDEAMRNDTFDQNDLTSVKMLDLGQHMMVYRRLENIENLYLVPPARAGGEWQTGADALRVMQTQAEDAPNSFRSFFRILEAYESGNPSAFNTLVGEYRQQLSHTGVDESRVDFEAFLTRFDPFMWCEIFYVFVLVLAVLSWLVWQRPLANAALCLMILTFVVHTFGLAARVYITGHPPVTTLYSSAVFIAWAAVGFTTVMELIYRNGVPSIVGAVVGFVSLLIAAGLATEGDTMEQLRAVLQTNVWLATHVVAVSLGYTATFVAGALGIGLVGTQVASNFSSKLRADTTWRKTLGSMIYGTVCFGLLFSFVGTILGGIWADQSWGRFWGWDPKENGAILIVLWNAVILHARWGGLVRERGMATLAVFGNVVTSWSWFGTNMLGVGLHSYGFMAKAFPLLISFDLSQMLIILVAVLPLERWLSRSAAPSLPGRFEAIARPVG